MRPKVTLRDVFGSGFLFSARASFGAPGWLPSDPAVLDFLTGQALGVAGNLPVLVSRGVADERGLDLLRRAGLELPADIRVYDDERGYRSTLARAQERVVLQHVHAPDELDADRCWILPTLLSFLNNKANLPELAPTGSVPRRTVIASHLAAPFDDSAWGLPLVIKVASNESSGGGHGIRICRTAAEIRAAVRDFRRCDTLIVEEFLPIRRSFCVQFAASRGTRGLDASVRPGKSELGTFIQYLGAPEQIVDADGRYQGSWLEPFSEPPDTVVQLGRNVMERAVALGYCGFAGFDIAQLDDDRFMVLDLNFRVNGSTPSLLLSSAIAEQDGTRVLRLLSMQIRGGWNDLLRITEAAVRDRSLIPLSTYRPPDRSGGNARLYAMIRGASRAEVARTHEALKQDGFE